MAVVTKRPNGKDYLDTPSSKLSKQQYVTKPENRHPTTHKYNVSGAKTMLDKHYK